MTTILFHYIHRDEGNWTDQLEVVIDNPNNLPLDEIEGRIKNALIDGQFFYHSDVGLLRSEYADCGDWHEFDRVEECSTTGKPLMTIDALLDNFEIAKQRREEISRKIHKVPGFIPVRLAVSWLEFLRETRQSIEIIARACKGKRTVMVFNNGDWELLSETLDLDARSGNFDTELRRDILRGLDRAVTIDRIDHEIEDEDAQ